MTGPARRTTTRSERGSARGITLAIVLAVALAGIAAVSTERAAEAVATPMVCTPGGGAPGAPEFDLVATKGRISTPDGNSLLMWGFADVNGTQGFQIPSPVLCVHEGDLVTVRLTNELAEPVSIVFPGQQGVSASGGAAGLFTAEVPGCPSPPCVDVVTYSFTAGAPGTFLYESGSAPHKQVQMGLYGALVVRPAMGANFAYNDATTEFDPGREFLILIHDIDPDLHRAVQQNKPYKVTAMHDRYWTINGRSFPDTIADNGVDYLPSQPYGAMVTIEASADENALPAMIRYVNAGMVNHPFHPHGNHMRVIGRDATPLVGPGGEDLSTEAFTKTIGSGQTYDLLFRWIDVEGWDAGSNPLPVDLPNLQNLVFKDDATFYSGDPYLGTQGELPVGVTSFNECGEFYFPWHSHALNEFQNFDEGFGGLATLVRVEPPGGC